MSTLHAPTHPVAITYLQKSCLKTPLLRVPKRLSIACVLLTLLSVQLYGQTNVAPEITGQNPLTTEQDTPIEIQFGDLLVTDPDNVYPDGFTLTLGPGENYTVTETTITPTTGFTGTLSVPVTVNDGEASSAPFALSIEVTPAANIAPVITGHAPLTTNEGTPITLSFADLTVEDPDDAYPTGFTMLLQPGPNYTVSAMTITPDAAFAGTLSVPVIVNDGEADSEPFVVTINVTASEPDNVPPVITGQSPLSTQENTAITIEFNHLTVTDPDDTYPAGFTLSVSPGANYTVGARTITPSNGFTGLLTVPVTVNDGEADSEPFELSIEVVAAAPENVKPTITGQAELVTEENKPIVIRLEHLQVTDPDDPYPTGFTIALAGGANYTVNGRTVNPNQGFTGSLTVPVTVNDGKDSSDPFGLIITVEPKPAQNIKPAITGQVPLTMLNSETLTVQLAHLIVSDPDNAYPQDFTLSVWPGDNYSVSGRTITPSVNFTGILTVGVSVNDGQAESDRFDLKITVNAPAPNTKPVITGQQELSTFVNTAITLRLTHLVVSDPDNDYPGDFRLDILSGNNYTTTGNEVKPSAGFAGTLSVGVRVNDGTDWSDPFNIVISVVQKDELRITGQDDIVVREDSTFILLPTHLIVNDPGGAYPQGFSLVVSNGENYAAQGTTITPASDFSGTLDIPVQVTSAAGASNVFRLVVVVTPVNDAPRFSLLMEEPVTYSLGDVATLISREAEIQDPDNSELVFAEVFVDAEDFDQGKDMLAGISSANIRSVYDPNTGVLVLLGQAPLAEYQEVIRSVTYHYENDTLPEPRAKRIMFRLNDGASFSDLYMKTILFGEGVALDIPNIFSPNGDLANDTWMIRSRNGSSNARVTVRVFDKRGGMVYESHSLDTPWDGRFRGENLPAGTYFYTVEVNSNANSLSKKGVVTILR